MSDIRRRLSWMADFYKTVAQLWPYEEFGEWSPEECFRLWRLHRDHALTGTKPSRVESSDFTKQVMLLVGMFLGRSNRIRMLDECGKGADDAAQEMVSHIVMRPERFKFEVEHPLALIKSFNTAMTFLMRDYLDASRNDATNVSSLAEEDDPMAWIKAPEEAGPAQVTQLLEQLTDEHFIQSAIAECDSIDATPEDLRALWLFQAKRIARENSLATFDQLPTELKAHIYPAEHAVVTVAVGTAAKNLAAQT